MSNNKAFRRSLIFSVLSLVLCFVMLIGTTFAWFTDSASSATSLISTGRLDVELEYKTSWGDAWSPVDDTTKLFREGALYEPGYTEVVFLRVSNRGSLALKYQLLVSAANEHPSTNVLGNTFKLSDYLEIGAYAMQEFDGDVNLADTTMPTLFGTREAALASVGTMTKLSALDPALRSNVPVLTGEKTSQVIALVLTMPSTVRNEANTAQGQPLPTLDLGVRIVATQLASESDGYGSDYDASATVGSVEDLKAALAGDYGEINLGADIALDETLTIGDGKDVTINLNGYSLAANAEAARAFKIDGEDVKLVINGEGTTSTFGNDTYGIVEIGAGSRNVDLTVNGGTYVGTTDAGAFLRLRSSENVTVTLNDVTFVDNCAPTSSSTNAWAISGNGANLTNVTVNINGGSYTAANGFACANASVYMKGVTLKAQGAGCEFCGVTLIEDSTITLDPGMYVSSADGACVAASNGGQVTVKSSTLESATYYAAVFPTGGSILIESSTVSGAQLDYIGGAITVN